MRACLKLGGHDVTVELVIGVVFLGEVVNLHHQGRDEALFRVEPASKRFLDISNFSINFSFTSEGGFLFTPRILCYHTSQLALALYQRAVGSVEVPKLSSEINSPVRSATERPHTK